MPEISIIVPVYKTEAYLHRCVDSIINQTYTDFELILVDDGSPDTCGTICDEYASNDYRVHVVHQKNGGLSAARNTGIDWAFIHSNSQWLTFIDSDDWVHPRYLELLIGAVRREQTNIAIGRAAWTSGDPLLEIVPESSKIWTSHDYYLKENVSATVAWGKLYKKTCFDSIRYPIRKLHEDEFVTYRILFEEDKISVLEGQIYAYYQNEDGIMHREWSPGRLDVLDALEGQIQFFLCKGFEDLAQNSFIALILNNSDYQNTIIHSNKLTGKERGKYLRYLRKRERQDLIRYYRFHWMPFWEGETSKRIYSEAFPIIGAARKIWQRIKKIEKR